MCVVTVVVTSLDNLDVSLSDSWLLSELLTEEVSNEVEVTAEEPANKTKGEHVTTLEHSLVVHACVSKSLLHDSCDRALDNTVRINTHLTEIVLSLESSLLKVALSERISINDDSCVWLSVTVLSLKGCSIHGYKYITLVTRSINLTCTDVNLET